MLLKLIRFRQNDWIFYRCAYRLKQKRRIDSILLGKRAIGVINSCICVCEIRFDGNLSRKNYAELRVSRWLASEKDGTTK